MRNSQVFHNFSTAFPQAKIGHTSASHFGDPTVVATLIPVYIYSKCSHSIITFTYKKRTPCFPSSPPLMISPSSPYHSPKKFSGTSKSFSPKFPGSKTMNGKSKGQGNVKTHYPYIQCDQHPTEPGYAVCIHVMHHGAAVVNFEPATTRQLGTVCCASCYALLKRHDASDTSPAPDEIEATLQNFRVCCAGHVRDQGWDKVTVQ